MIIAVIILGCALLAVAVYAATLRARLQNARQDSERLRSDDERFRSLAVQVLEDSRRNLSRDTTEQMASLLSPLRHDIAAFNRSIDEKYSREASERGALREKIDELHRLNITLGQEAKQLADALKGNSKVQGDWGEMILSRLLEQAGFTEGREFEVQKNVKDAAGSNYRPDIVVHYPNRGCVVIDSKVSLTAYVNLCGAETEDARRAAGTAHVSSVRAHVKELAAKKYQDIVGNDHKLDFVMMFIPNEGAYISAMQLAPELWQEAYDRRVLIISPTHLFSVLKLIQQMWQHDDQTKNATKIAEEAGKMYDKFVGFLTDMAAVESRLNQALDAHGAAMKKLSDGTGNLIKRAEDLRKLGAKARNEIKVKS